MNRSELALKLRGLGEEDARRFAGTLAERSRSGPRAAVELWLSPEEAPVHRDGGVRPPVQYHARGLLIRADEQKIVPMLEAPSPGAPTNREWRFMTTGETELELRRRIVKVIDPLLDDSSPLDTDVRDAGAQTSNTRVCDRAYLSMRKVVHFDDPSPANLNAEAFLRLPPAVRDAKIREARAAKTWVKALTGEDIGDE